MESTETSSAIDLDRLLKLRLVVARHGETDLAKWWNTKGMLGADGALVLERGFPRTHYFAQARVVFAVARARCAELFDPPGCMTLWSLPANLEDRFEEHWRVWLTERDAWVPFFEELAALPGHDLLAELESFDLIDDEARRAVASLSASDQGPSLPLPDMWQPTDGVVTLLAAGFAKGQAGAPLIPYARLGEAQ